LTWAKSTKPIDFIAFDTRRTVASCAALNGGCGNVSGIEAILGGDQNWVSGRLSTTSGGGSNSVTNELSSISGGYQNTVNGSDSSVLGGRGNLLGGSCQSIPATPNNAC
jgi:hypothetical protein